MESSKLCSLVEEIVKSLNTFTTLWLSDRTASNTLDALCYDQMKSNSSDLGEEKRIRKKFSEVTPKTEILFFMMVKHT